MRRSRCAPCRCAVGATLVVGPVAGADAVHKLGDHKGRPYGAQARRT